MKRWFMLVLVTGSLGTVIAAPAGAQVIGTETPGGVAPIAVANGRIAYVTDSRRCDDCHVFTIEPDGSGRVRLTDLAIGGPEWSPDGTRLIFPAIAEDGRVTTATIEADGTGFAVFEIPDPTLNVACWSWSPDGNRLACESWDDTQPDRGGLYTVSSTDGQDLERLTTNPYGGGDFPGDFSPDGARYVFPRENPQRRNGNVAVFVVNADGSGATRLTPWRMNAESVELVARRRAHPVRRGRHVLHRAPGRHRDHPDRAAHRRRVRLPVRSELVARRRRASSSPCTCDGRTRSTSSPSPADGSDLAADHRLARERRVRRLGSGALGAA